ncbi:hypothetical protein G6F56_001892 [Rhizopus delemar]|nr:hypothetical protein G6F56_001892 [Rhizopus delemar]
MVSNSRIPLSSKRAKESAKAKTTDRLIETSRKSSRLTQKRIVADSNVISTKIKNHAINMILDSVYNKLDEDKKNTISNSFNSVLDLSNEREGANTQKSLFSDFEWRDLKQKYKPLINWITLEPRITKKLKIIEKVHGPR